MDACRIGPAAKSVIDGEQVHGRQLPGVFGLGLGGARPVKVLADDVLRFLGIQVLQIRLRNRSGAFAIDIPIHHRDGRLGQNRQARVNEIHPIAKFFLQQISFVFPAQEHITLVALSESDRRSAGAGIEHGNVLVKLLHEGLRLLVAAVLAFRELPGREVIPARTAGGFGIGGDDAHIRPDEIIPVLDVFRVACTNHQHNRGGVG